MATDIPDFPDFDPDEEAEHATGGNPAIKVVAKTPASEIPSSHGAGEDIPVLVTSEPEASQAASRPAKKNPSRTKAASPLPPSVEKLNQTVSAVAASILNSPTEYNGSVEHAGLIGTNYERALLTPFLPIFQAQAEVLTEFGRMMAEHQRILQEDQKNRATTADLYAEQSKNFAIKSGEVIATSLKVTESVYERMEAMDQRIGSIQGATSQNSIQIQTLASGTTALHEAFLDLIHGKLGSFITKLGETVSLIGGQSVKDAVIRYSLAIITLMGGLGLGFIVCWLLMNSH